MAIDTQTFAERQTAWTTAETLVRPIVEEHGLEPYSTGPNMFAQTMVKNTAVDQHLDHILRVADWLLDS